MAAFSRIKIDGMNPAPHLILVGPMGAGKTSIGRRLAERLGLPFTDMDTAIEAHAGTKVTTIFDLEGEAGFRAREREMLAEVLHSPAGVIATGGGDDHGGGIGFARRRGLREEAVERGQDIGGQLVAHARILAH